CVERPVPAYRALSAGRAAAGESGLGDPALPVRGRLCRADKGGQLARRANRPDTALGLADDLSQPLKGILPGSGAAGGAPAPRTCSTAAATASTSFNPSKSCGVAVGPEGVMRQTPCRIGDEPPSSCV